MTVNTIQCIYPGDIRDDMENAFSKIIDQYGGEHTDSGWGCGERDMAAEFDDLTEPQMQSIAVEMLAAGCASAEWEST